MVKMLIAVNVSIFRKKITPIFALNKAAPVSISGPIYLRWWRLILVRCVTGTLTGTPLMRSTPQYWQKTWDTTSHYHSGSIPDLTATRITSFIIRHSSLNKIVFIWFFRVFRPVTRNVYRAFFFIENILKINQKTLDNIKIKPVSLYQQKPGTAPEYKPPKFFMRLLINQLWQIAKENPRGFTISVPDLEPITNGWCIGHRDTQYSFGKKGLAKVVAHALETTKVVGGWKGYDGRYYFDTVIIEHNTRAALDLKADHQQKAIYNLTTGKLM